MIEAHRIGAWNGGTDYVFRVTAVNTYGNSPFTDATDVVQTINAAPYVYPPTYDNLTDTGVTLSVYATDDGGPDALIYTWSVSSGPTDGAWFSSENGTHDGSTVNVTFTHAGDYVFDVEVADGLGLSDPSVAVPRRTQTLTSIVVTPGDKAILEGRSISYAATGYDQYGDPMPTPPSVTWSVVSGGGSFSGNTYTAASTGSGDTVVVRATSDTIYGSANVAVKLFQPVSYERAIGDGTTLLVENGATKLYLGFHDFIGWNDNWNNVSVTLVWEDGSGNQIPNPPNERTTVEATANISYAFAPSGDNGVSGTIDGHYYYDSHIDSFRPAEFSVPERATSVTISASGWWGNNSQDPAYESSDPGGQYWATAEWQKAQPTNGVYKAAKYNSSHITSYSFYLGELVGLWGAPPQLLDMTVTDHAIAANSATAITDAAIKDLYVAEDADGLAEVDLSATFSPDNAGQYIKWKIEQDSSVLKSGDFADPNALSDIVLHATDEARDFVFTSWYDADHDGQLDTGEDSREVDVHVADLSIRTDHNDDSVINSIDDMLNLREPTSLHFEGEGPRIEIDLDAGFDVSASGWRAILPNVPGLEFWNQETGGTRWTPDSNGNLVDASLSSPGEYTGTVWCSGDPNSKATTNPDTGIPVVLPISLDMEGPDGISKYVLAQVEVVPTKVFFMNRKLGAKGDTPNTAKDALDLVSHTFVYTTDANGLVHTYSWGNEFANDNPSHWYPDKEADESAATQAITGKGPKGWPVEGISNGDVATAFLVLMNHSEANEGGSHHKWMPFATCKEEAAKLVALARIAKAKNDNMAAVLQYVQQNVWVVGGYLPRTHKLARDFLQNLNKGEKSMEEWLKATNLKMQQGVIKDVSTDIKQMFQFVVGHLPKSAG